MSGSVENRLSSQQHDIVGQRLQLARLMFSLSRLMVCTAICSLAVVVANSSFSAATHRIGGSLFAAYLFPLLLLGTFTTPQVPYSRVATVDKWRFASTWLTVIVFACGFMIIPYYRQPSYYTDVVPGAMLFLTGCATALAAEIAAIVVASLTRQGYLMALYVPTVVGMFCLIVIYILA